MSDSLWDMAGLVGLAAVLLGLCSSSGGLWSLAAAPWGLALLGWVGLRGVMLWRRGCMQRAVHARATQLQNLVHNSKMLTGLSRKALRLVQETEVISRGFTLCLGEVQRSYDFHRHFETQLRTTGSDRTGRAREKCRELNTLHTSIRSLQLHLKALLSEMIILEDDLEKLMVSKEPTELSFEGYQDLSDRLHQLQPHMQASAGCWEDTISQVERMMRRANACPGNAQCLQHCGPPVQEIPAAPPSYPLILDRDPVPEELEWEAYVSDSDSDGEGQGSWSDILSPEERERQRREREESRRVLSELKAVLGFRASEGERMKRKQLLFNDQAAVTLSAHAESSDPATNPSDAPAETNAEEGNHLSEFPAGSEGEEEEGKDEGRVRPDPVAEPVTEFICGLEAKEGELGGASVCTRGGGGASELHQYDGVLEAGEGQNGLDCFLMRKVPAVSVMDRLTEIHGPEALSFSSALAAQVAARSHSLVNMEEQTFGDDDEEEEEEEEEEDRRAPEKD
ncbi:Vezatin [Larimichthys crocea]|uniref:Uncharacterized protein n=1 Tax=Larimichthys crocea TaxID=215358 RepID=A0ACD3Q7L2_LARCR|nr:Vezatin [Larimichthys crocea]